MMNLMNQNNRQAAIEVMMTKTSAIQREYREQVQNLIAIQNMLMQETGYQVEDDYKANRVLLAFLSIISIIVGCIMGWYITRIITRPLEQAVDFSKSIASGDLTKIIQAESKDETGILLESLDEMKGHLLDIVQEVQNSSESISAAAGQIVAGNQNLAARTEEQAASVEQTASSMEQITSTVQTRLSTHMKQPCWLITRL